MALIQPIAQPTRESDIKNINKIKSIRISLISADEIRARSYGEVKNPETIDYKTHRPKMEGLFCEGIFGPVKDYECSCGKFKGVKHKGVTCDRCGVEVIQSKVRRDRLGHIELQMPVAHVWYSKGVPGRLAMLLDMHTKALERVLYYEEYLVLDGGSSEIPGWEDCVYNLESLTVLSELEYHTYQEEYGDLEVMMGAEAIKKILEQIDLARLAEELRKVVRTSNSKQKVKKAIKRLKLVEDFRNSNNHPAWMIVDVLPVLPPDLRPLVPLDGGRFATSDLNDLYRRVINRNNRLQRLKEVRAPEVIIRNEKRMLQESVDALLDNGRRGRPVKGSNNRPLKSLSDMLKGKQGRFRQNLLGKRVDYSGRSVIVVGPDLKFHQCGLPKKMALELFEPFIIHHLERLEHVNTIRSAKRLIEQEHPVVFDVLEKVIASHVVLLNRAPTLHRLGIQAFQPVLVEGKAIQLHPLTCAAFNADFDGDQMAVHVPLSNKSQQESKMLMLASRNILAPKDGKPIATPSQDIVLGCYYLTKMSAPRMVNGKEAVRRFGSPMEALVAYDQKIISLREEIEVRIISYEEVEIFDYDKETGEPLARSLGDRVYIAESLETRPDGSIQPPVEHLLSPEEQIRLENRELLAVRTEFVRTSVGRLIFNEALTPELRFVNELMSKKQLSNLVLRSFNVIGMDATSALLDRIKDLGFMYAKVSGLSIALDDMLVPDLKWDLLKRAQDSIGQIRKQFENGVITDIERYNKVVDTWIRATNQIAEEMMVQLRTDQDGLNPIFVMEDSGSRGSKQQIRQLAGMRGLMNKPIKRMTGGIGEIIETPITANLREGLTVLEYFISTHGSRKGLADTALKTAEAGYLTRRLVDVSQDMIVNEEDCGTIEGVEVTAIKEGDQVIEPLYDRILGRSALVTIRNPLQADQELLLAGATLDEEALSTMIAASQESRYPVREVTVEGEYGEAEDVSLVSIDWWTNPLADLMPILGGKVLAAPVMNPYNVLVEANDEITEEVAQAIVRCGLEKVLIRSVLTCKSARGVCVRCYGRDLARGHTVLQGEAVGVIAAQSIGEPGTQLTLRTFHIGGTTSRILTESQHHAQLHKGEVGCASYLNLEGQVELDDEGRRMVVGRNGKVIIVLSASKATHSGKIEIVGDEYVVDSEGHIVVMSDHMELLIRDKRKEILTAIRLPYGARLANGVKDKASVNEGDLLFEREPWSWPLIAGHDGYIRFTELQHQDEMGDARQHITLKQLQIVDRLGDGAQVLEEKLLTPGADLLVEDQEKVSPGQFLAHMQLPVVCAYEGKCRFIGIEEGRTMQRRLNPTTGNLQMIITQADEHRVPRISILGRKGEVLATHYLPIGCQVMVTDNQDVFPGTVLARSEHFRQESEVPVGAILHVADKEVIESAGLRKTVLASWDAYQEPILAKRAGTLKYRDIEEGVTVRRQRDLDPRTSGSAETGGVQLIVMEQKEEKHPRLEIVGDDGQVVVESLPSGAHIMVGDNQVVRRGMVLARIPKETFKSRDVTGGLPRIEEIFEARRPKPRNLAIIARVSGWVKILRPTSSEKDTAAVEKKLGKKRKRGTRLVAIGDTTGEILEAYEIEVGKHLIRSDGEWVNAGDKLVEGAIDPHEYLEVLGEKKTGEYLLNEIQEVYRLQGVGINDKHIEVIVRQMMRKVTITDSGDSSFLPEEEVDRFLLLQENAQLEAQGLKPAKFQSKLSGVTKASLGTDSFLSAASFQETTRVLTTAAIAEKVDTLSGLKENVIIGHLIPAGTGTEEYERVRYEMYGHYLGEDSISEPTIDAVAGIGE